MLQATRGREVVNPVALERPLRLRASVAHRRFQSLSLFQPAPVRLDAFVYESSRLGRLFLPQRLGALALDLRLTRGPLRLPRVRPGGRLRDLRGGIRGSRGHDLVVVAGPVAFLVILVCMLVVVLDGILADRRGPRVGSPGPRAGGARARCRRVHHLHVLDESLGVVPVLVLALSLVLSLVLVLVLGAGLVDVTLRRGSRCLGAPELPAQHVVERIRGSLGPTLRLALEPVAPLAASAAPRRTDRPFAGNDDALPVPPARAAPPARRPSSTPSMMSRVDVPSSSTAPSVLDVPASTPSTMPRTASARCFLRWRVSRTTDQRPTYTPAAKNSAKNISSGRCAASATMRSASYRVIDR